MTTEGTQQTALVLPDEKARAYEPQEVMQGAYEAAKALMQVVAHKKKPVILNDEQYLEYEDWQTLGQFYGVTAITGDAVPVEVDGVKGAKAVAKLIDFRTGAIKGGAEAYCMRDEANWQAKPWFQLASMAQTRAGAKALRNRLAWIAVLAGYRPTPAEEMGEQAAEQHWCPLHSVAFFKRGKMKSYAHPIEGSKDWCHERQKAEPGEVGEAEPAASAPASAPAAEAVAHGAQQPVAAAEGGGVSAPPSPESHPVAAQPTKAVKPPRHPDSISTYGQLLKVCHEDFGLQPKQVFAELNVTAQSELTEPASACYRRIAAVCAVAPVK